MRSLVIKVNFHDGRFHGLDASGHVEWPPSPARLFQALVAAASRGSSLASDDLDALQWLEKLPPPIIAAPVAGLGQVFSHFMPNNDLDTKGGDPRRIGEVRKATKRYRPQIFDRSTALLYVWSFDDGDAFAHRICAMAKQIYQLGRGVDMAWATAEVVSADEGESSLAVYHGKVHRPSSGSTNSSLPCPLVGSLESLIGRYGASRLRFKEQCVPAPTKNDPQRTKPAGYTFAQPPKPRFRQIAYASPPTRLLYELHDGDRGAGFYAWPLREIGTLVKIIRDQCAVRLEAGLQTTSNELAAAVKRVFGLCRDATETDKTMRIRIIPLPSIGHTHADHGIRRVLVEVPSNCPIPVRDIDWTFSSFSQFDPATGAVAWMLTQADGQPILRHFGIDLDEPGCFHVWRSVTPVALPVARSHGRNSGPERVGVEAEAAQAVRLALRQASMRKQPTSIRVQREPFATKGAMAGSFGAHTRFDGQRLWHVELAFAEPVSGPLIAGNGRYLGLGLFAPYRDPAGVVVFSVTGGMNENVHALALARALRRAVMARVQLVLGKRAKLPAFFTGHERDGSVARRGSRSHLAYAFDSLRGRLLVFAPHVMDRREPGRDERMQIATLEAAVQGMHCLRAGASGVLELSRTRIDPETDPLFRRSHDWTTQSSYKPTRHYKCTDPVAAIRKDVLTELLRRNLSAASEISLDAVQSGPRGGLSANVTIQFAVAVPGPILLGRTSNFGGGLFTAAS